MPKIGWKKKAGAFGSCQVKSAESFDLEVVLIVAQTAFEPCFNLPFLAFRASQNETFSALGAANMDFNPIVPDNGIISLQR